jgi:hypothetical protein
MKGSHLFWLSRSKGMTVDNMCNKWFMSGHLISENTCHDYRYRCVRKGKHCGHGGKYVPLPGCPYGYYCCKPCKLIPEIIL